MKSIKVPIDNSKPVSIKGRVLWLHVGEKKLKFFVHGDGECDLSFYASGCIVARLDMIQTKISKKDYRGDYTRYKASIAIGGIINFHDVDEVIKILNSSEVLNA